MEWQKRQQPKNKISKQLAEASKDLEQRIVDNLMRASKDHAINILSSEIPDFDESKVNIRFQSFYYAIDYDGENVGRVFIEACMEKDLTYNYTLRYERVVCVDSKQSFSKINLLLWIGLCIFAI